MTKDPERMVHVYTLVPSLVDEAGGNSAVEEEIREWFRRMTNRHEKSGSVLSTRVISIRKKRIVSLEDQDFGSLIEDGDTMPLVGGKRVESRLRHSALLEKHHELAGALPDYLLSAKASPDDTHRVFVLLQHGEEDPFSILYDASSDAVKQVEATEALDAIACKADEPKASISAADVERAINETARRWCERERIPISEVTKLCGMYLVARKKAKTPRYLFDGHAMPSKQNGAS